MARGPALNYTPVSGAPVEPAALSPEELLRDGALTRKAAVAFSGISRAELDALTRSGAVPSFKRGKTRLIPKRGLQLYLVGLYRESNAGV